MYAFVHLVHFTVHELFIQRESTFASFRENIRTRISFFRKCATLELEINIPHTKTDGYYYPTSGYYYLFLAHGFRVFYNSTKKTEKVIH